MNKQGDWASRGVCRERPELFAVPDARVSVRGVEIREGPSARIQRERAAVQMCWRCPVWRECREWALQDSGQVETVCGGLTPKQLREERARTVMAVVA
ncbi:WhiB family transcriptional regulator [Nocardiopsis synnemataformans]|uniref:WhiB family transcriptional regulator n=1 Tax=Nocardiopsis synnemataformans TaxID=61305 RepID=UPI003EBDFDED